MRSIRSNPLAARAGVALFLAALLAVGRLVVGCSSSNTSGGCTTDAQCKGDRICVKGVCTAPSSPTPSGTSTGAPTHDGDAGYELDAYDPDDDGGGIANGVNIFCTVPDQGICYCGHDQSFGGTTAQSCTAALVGSGSICCASEGWPSSGYCTCDGPALCQEFDDTCQCDLAGSLMTDDMQVSSCSFSGTCCQTADAFGTLGCACYTETDIQCDANSGWSTASGCGPTAAGCGPGTSQTDSCR